jgi:Flp pilus assembly protein TadB
MIITLLTHTTPSQLIVLLFLLGLLIFFLKDAGFTTILIVLTIAIIMGLVLVPWSEKENFDKDDIMDWKLVNRLWHKDD